jgi:hypothetical protein
MDRYGHLFKFDQHQAVMDGIAAQFTNPAPMRTNAVSPKKLARFEP